ncbi:hypothetical protein Purlil1_13730 [Purpureocillium lilacinum]|uniref:Uncharacterized protein n=1 Tax=Purpureocillium lilacinum TaxID=33203 RepID=A0ABR0BDB0_PURLI|nr:hypothetical protein Purlil1_13730 [Purpureocillium lilacinum]
MSSTIFCCGQITPYRPQHLSHESKFTSFLAWAAFPRKSSVGNVPVSGDIAAPFAIQLVRQVNFGPLESKRYFIPCTDAVAVFDEVNEDALIQANFQKLNTYKNYKCDNHNKFFELNVYQKDPINRHHWRANLARPAREIDLVPRVGLDQPESSVPVSSVTRAVHVSEPHESTATSEDGNDETRWRLLDFSPGSDGGPLKDLTACDKECGYCGQCDY